MTSRVLALLCVLVGFATPLTAQTIVSVYVAPLGGARTQVGEFALAPARITCNLATMPMQDVVLVIGLTESVRLRWNDSITLLDCESDNLGPDVWAIVSNQPDGQYTLALQLDSFDPVFAAGTLTKSTTALPPPPPSLCPAAATNSWTGCYYNGQNLESFAFSRIEPAINFNWGSSGPIGIVNDPSQPADAWSATWEGDFPFEAGDHVLTTSSDDGIEVFIDGVPILTRWVARSAVTEQTPFTVTAGTHRVKVKYFESSGLASVAVSWAPVVVAPPPPPPVDCTVSAWSEWSAWTAIDATTEQRTRTRTVTQPAANGGTACPALTETETRPIVLPPPPPPPVDPCVADPLTVKNIKWPTANTGTRSLTFSTGTKAWRSVLLVWGPPLTLTVTDTRGCVVTVQK